MDVKNLKNYIEENGNEFKNYRHLCEVLEIEPKHSNSKKSQEKEMAQYFEVVGKEGTRRLIVKRIYDTRKIDNTTNYNELIQLLLTDYFLDKRHVVASTNFLLFNVNMINAKYSKNRNNKKNYAEELNVDVNFIYDFFNTTDDTLKPAIETALRNLRYKSLILYSWEPIVVDFNDIHRVATLDERHAILEAENFAKKKLGYEDYREIMFNIKKLHESRKIQSEYLLEKGYNIKMNYMGYSINILQKEMAEAQEKMIIKLLDEAEKEGYQNKLNLTIIERLLKNAKSRNKKAMNIDEKVSKHFRTTRGNFNYNKIMERIIKDNIESNTEITDEDIQVIKVLSAFSSEPYQHNK